jgi:hypothetical protein
MPGGAGRPLVAGRPGGDTALPFLLLVAAPLAFEKENTSMAEHPIVGAWRLVSFAFTGEAAQVSYPLGESPGGGVIFTADGHMSLDFMAGGRPAFAADDILGGTPEELAAAAGSFVAFGGPYRIEDGAVFIDVKHSLHPNWTGQAHKRLFQVSGDRLSLRTPEPILLQGKRHSGEATFERL